MMIISRDVNNIIEISNAEKENNLTNTLMKRMSTSLKYKVLSLSMLKSAKHLLILSSEDCIIDNLKILRQLINLDKYNLNAIQTV
ncbi:hypothetical protein EMPG_11009 [Blastomyces silverae]|uniref:Uncharacterized protein n=1 Tax=Blastomyces silverae TaxID=2060906 RepID=A0A0H1B252_9EURO|nr:hypothetical protein EMPG_11009 [Blastomyces silverae]